MLERFHGCNNHQDILGRLPGLPVQEIRNKIRELYLGGLGIEAVQQLSELAKETAAAVVRQSALANKTALIFIGSAGRSEMCFKSDVDYILLLDPKILTKPDINQDVTVLQDRLKQELKAARFGRTSCFGIGDSDYIISGAKFSLLDRLVLLDCQFVAGNETLFNSFKNDADNEVHSNEEATLLNMLFIYRRFRRFPPFSSMGPDIKSGRGGIRDLQFLVQLAKIRYSSSGPGISDCIRDLRGRAITKEEAKILTGAINYIYCLRNELHYQSHSENDVLDLKTCGRIAPTLNQSKEKILARYKLHSRRIYEIVRSVKREVRKTIEDTHSEKWTEDLLLCEDPCLPRETALQLAAKGSRELLLALAWRSKDPVILREVMRIEEGLRARDWNILFALAHNSRTPDDVFCHLLRFHNHGNSYRKIPPEVLNNPGLRKRLRKTRCNDLLKKLVHLNKQQLLHHQHANSFKG